jgi:hypothetical protein
MKLFMENTQIIWQCKVTEGRQIARNGIAVRTKKDTG